MRHRANSQEGVTLFLAILVLSSILAISFSLATILFIEVQTSSDLTKTEGALAGANGVAEQSLFNIKRSVPCDTNCYTTTFSNHVVLANNSPQTTTIASPNFVDKVSPTSNSLANTTNKYDFCSINADPNQGCGYGKVTVTYEPSGNNDQMVIYLCEFDASGNTPYNSPPCTDTADTYWNNTGNCGTSVMTQNGCQTQTWTLDTTKQQELIIYNGNQASTQDMFVQIQTFDTDGTTPKGLPYANKTAVSINTLNGQVGRKIKVVIPNPAGSVASGPPVALINAGGGSYSNSEGTWTDAGYSGGSTFSTATAINGTADQELYQSERFGDIHYVISGLTPNSSHTVVLKFAEIYWTSPGQRVFNVDINQTTVLNDFDIVAQAGAFTAIDKSFSVNADSSGVIDIHFYLGSNGANNPKINAIEVH